MLARSSTHRILGGVCGGIAEWLGWSVATVRVLYVLLSILSAAFPGILVYVILWIAMPDRRDLRMLLPVALLLWAGGAAAQAPPAALPDSTEEQRRSVAVTVYNGDLGLVREVRALEIPKAGIGTLRFADVPSLIDPRTVHLRSLKAGDGLAVVEQNYEYDLLSPDRLLERYVGREVLLVEQAEDLTQRTVPATLLSTAGGPVYKVGDRILLGYTGRLSLPELPRELVARPTLVWTLDAPAAGARDVEASYLTSGLSWSADYVAVVGEDGKAASLSGWVTLDNRSGATFENAQLKVVAGDVRRQAHDVYGGAPKTMAMEAARAPQFQEEGFFEYHLYTLDRPTTLKNNQTKQLALLSAAAVPLQRKLVLVGEPVWQRNRVGTFDAPQKVSVFLEFVNAQAGGLGMPLPKGIVRVYQKDRSGAEQFVGEDAIDHTPRDERVTLHVGDAFDVVAERVQTDQRQLSPRQSEAAWRITLRNRKEEDVAVTVREPMGGDWEIVESSHRPKKVDARTVEFEVPVKAGQEAVLTYRARVTW